MSQVAISGNASGTGVFTVASPNSNNNYTATLAAGTGTVVLDTLAQTLTNKTLTSPTIDGTPVMGASVITSGTAVASTSGTSIAFTSIPSWVKRITVMFQGVSTNGTSNLQIQLGTGATPTYTTSGYSGTCSQAGGNTTMSAAFVVNSNVQAAATYSGIITICLVSGNIYAESGTLNSSTAINGCFSGGSVSLAAALTAVRITTANGTDTFDAGSINILYE